MNIKIGTNASEVSKSVRRANKEYRALMQEAVGAFLERSREEAAKRIVPTSHPNIRHPRSLRRLQPSVPGKLTERTGKLIWALKQDLDTTGRGFKGGTRRSKQTALYTETVSRSLKSASRLEEYIGSLHFEYHGHGRLMSKHGGMPQESPQSLYMRHVWDKYGIRGQKRLFLTPAAESIENKELVALAEKRIARALETGGL